jgi:integrase
MSKPEFNALSGPHGLVRSRPGGVWSYRITIGGKREKLTTKTADLEEASRIAKQAQLDNAAKAATNARLDLQPMRFDRACDIWMQEQAPQMKERDLVSQVEWLKGKLGDKLLHMLRAGDISAVRNARAKTVRTVRRGAGGNKVVALTLPDGSPRFVTPTTVNKTLRLVSRILNHAVSNHDAETRRFKWADFYLKTVQAKPRPISPENEKRIMAELRLDYRPLTVFVVISGLRANENLVRKDQVDFDNQQLINVVSKTHPEGRDVPLSDAEMAIVRAEYYRNDNDTDYVFTYEADATRKIGRTERWITRGQRVPITYAGWKGQWAFMRKVTGLKVTIHQLRHTAASRALKATGNLKAVQEMLGHSTPVITAKIYGEADAAMIRNAKQATQAPAPVAPEVAPRGKTRLQVVGK